MRCTSRKCPLHAGCHAGGAGAPLCGMRGTSTLRRVHPARFLSSAVGWAGASRQGARVACGTRATGLAAWRRGSSSTASDARRGCGGAHSHITVAQVASWHGPRERTCAWRRRSSAVAACARIAHGGFRSAGGTGTARTIVARRSNGAACARRGAHEGLRCAACR